MQNVIGSERLPIKMWLKDIEAGALEQAKNLANLPFIHKWVVLMPDCHQGYGMPIGGVIATKGVIIPNAVGVDIGCGMCSIKTSLTEASKEDLKTLMGLIRKKVPLGFDHQEEMQDENLMPSLAPLSGFDSICARQFQSAQKQIGTLGGGNHFIEIQKGSDGHVWIMIHSGSRNLGKRVADHYNKIAVELNETYYSVVDKKQELAFLPINTEEAHHYKAEMQYCADFAFANRRLMMCNICDAFRTIFSDIKFDDMINIAHNYARYENHYNENVIVHRKGATSAKLGEIGIIPGSQGSKSYIVEGLGNEQSFTSCSHGAGRKMGRNEAKKNLSLEAEVKLMEDQGIIHGMRHLNDLDEAAGAYKDIDEVMQNQNDLVKILVELKPLAVIKG